MQTPRLRDGERRCAHVLQEEPIEMPRADADTRRELADTRLIERPFVDEAQGAPYHGGGSEPGGRAGRCLRAAPQARSEARLGRGRRGGEVADVAAPRGRRCRTDRATVDPG